MARNRSNIKGRTNRPGATLVYVMMLMAVLLGFCSLAVDLSRVETAKTELQRAADAAAMAGAAALQSGASATAIKTEVALMADQPVDGVTFSLNTTTDVQFLNWTSASATPTVESGTTGANAIRVYCRRTTSESDPITLLFGEALGVQSASVWASSVAYIDVQTETLTVNGNANPWLAGMPTGTTASEPDSDYPSANHPYKYDIAGPVGGVAASGEAYESPPEVNFTPIPGATLQITSATGTTQKGPEDTTATADGVYTTGGSVNMDDDEASGGVSENGIADVTMPGDSLNGVFLDANQPNTEGAAPTPLDFSTSTEQNYTTISPLVRQPFFIGNGQDGSTQQSIIVPSGATRFYFGVMDGHEWSNNAPNLSPFTAEGYSVTVTQTSIQLAQ
jgi:Flp pilus assembly protein TadG